MTAAAQAQTSLYETEIDNPDLEALLETRQKAAEDRVALNATHKQATEDAKKIIETLDLGDAPVRVGRFLLKPKHREQETRSFIVPAKDTVQISLLPAD